MKRLEDVKLAPNEREALAEIRRRLFDALSIEQIILFGSVARGEADEESDIDLLVVATRPVARPENDAITRVVFQVNSRFGTNYSAFAIDKQTWEQGIFSILPFKQEVLKDGVPV